MAKHYTWRTRPRFGSRPRTRRNLAVTRLRSETGLPDRTTPFPYETAFAVQVQLRRVSPVKLWLGGRLTALEAIQEEGSVSIIDLKQEPSMYLGSAFDMVQFYIPRAALDEFADENDGSRCETLSWPSGKVDSGLKNLASCLLPALEEARFRSELYVDHLVFAAHAYIARTYGGIKPAPSMVRGGLAPWQLNRAMEMLKANLDGQIGLSRGGARMQIIRQPFRARVQAGRRSTAIPLASAAAHRCSQGTPAPFRPAHGRDRAQVRICRPGMFHPGISQVA